jgi:hypothetical protein
MRNEAPAPVPAVAVDAEAEAQFQLFRWQQDSAHFPAHRLVPQNLAIPVNSLKAGFRLWVFGNRQDGIRPYKLLQPAHLPGGNQRTACSKYRRATTQLVEQAVRCRLIAAETELTDATCDRVFDRCYAALLEQAEPGLTTKRVKYQSYAVSRVYDLFQTAIKNRIGAGPAATSACGCCIHRDVCQFAQQ